jgi:hypothetical protein
VTQTLIATVNPQISSTPPSGPRGTTFTITATGFTPNGNIIEHIRKPDGTEYPTNTYVADADGNRVQGWTSSSTSPLGSYTVWWIDQSSGRQSNNVTQTITATINPLISSSPPSGPRGTTFTITATGFTPNGTIIEHIRKPDGTEYPVNTYTADANGNRTQNWTSSSTSPLGTYTIWWIDQASGRQSNSVTQTLTATFAPTIGSREGSTYAEYFANLILLTLDYSESLGKPDWRDIWDMVSLNRF